MCFKEYIFQINFRRVFHPTQPCSLQMCRAKSLDRAGLRFISPRTAREKFLIPSPSSYTGAFTQFLNNNSPEWIFNAVTLQSMKSKVSGHYCLYYALFRSRNINMSAIVHRFSNNKRRNDFAVNGFIEKKFPSKSLKISHLCKQTRIKSTAARSVKTTCNFISTCFIEYSKKVVITMR